jgi:hypothetical protein
VVGIISTLSARASVGFFVKSTIRSVIAIARGVIVSTFCLLDLCVDFFAQTPELVGHFFHQLNTDLVQEGAVDPQGSVEFMVDIFWDQSATKLPENFGMSLMFLPHGQHFSTPGIEQILLPWLRTNHQLCEQAAQAHECAKTVEGLVGVEGPAE